MAFGNNPLTGRPGPTPHPARDGDKKQARHRVNCEVRAGAIPAPNDLPCVDCGHRFSSDGKRHEYDHHKGYAPEHHLTVEPVCKDCHSDRDNAKAKQSHCVNGHEFTAENTIHPVEGGRACLECRRIYDRSRGRDAAYWREYRAKRKLANG